METGTNRLAANGYPAVTVTAPRGLCAPLEKAHTRLCLVTVELIGDYFIWQSPEAKHLLDETPALNDARLDSIIGSIRKGARIPCDCAPEHWTWLADTLASARRIRNYDARREVLEGYSGLLREYQQVNRLSEAWQTGNREVLAETLAEFHDQVHRTQTREQPGLPWAQVADAPAVPEPLFQYGPPPGGFGLIIGADGVGKGWLTLDLMLGCALARPMNIPLFRRKGPPLRVRYLCYEDDPRILRWRLDRVCESAGCDPNTWRDAERAGTLQFAANLEPLFIQGGHGAPRPTDTFRNLAASLKKEPADLCIIDPLAAAALVQSENDNSALNTVAVTLRELARETQCAILLTHHTSKAQRDAADQHASRGGSALTGAARWVLRLIQGGRDCGQLTAAIPKNSYGRGISDITLTRLENGVLREISGAALGKQKEALIEAVVCFVNDHPDLEINPNAVCRNNSTGAKALIRHLGVPPKAAAEAVEKALDQELLQLEERQRPGSRRTYQILAPFPPDEVPF